MDRYIQKLRKMGEKQLRREYWKVRTALEEIEEGKTRKEGFCFFCKENNRGVSLSCIECGAKDHYNCIKKNIKNHQNQEYVCPICDAKDSTELGNSDDEYVPDVDINFDDLVPLEESLSQRKRPSPKPEARPPKKRIKQSGKSPRSILPPQFHDNPYVHLNPVELVEKLVEFEKALQRSHMNEELNDLRQERERLSKSRIQLANKNRAMEMEIKRLRKSNQKLRENEEEFARTKNQLELLEMEHRYAQDQNTDLKQRLRQLSGRRPTMSEQAWAPTSPGEEVMSPTGPLHYGIECEVCGQTGGHDLFICYKCQNVAIHQHCARHRISNKWKCSDCTDDFTFRNKIKITKIGHDEDF